MSAVRNIYAPKAPATFVTAGAASTQLVPARGGRDTLLVSNDHATQVIYITLGTPAAVAGSGIRIGPGVTLTLEGYSGPAQVIATGAASNVCVQEL